MHEGWTETRLGDIAATVSPSACPRDPVPYVGLEHFDSGSPRLSRWASTAEVASITTAFEPGDVLFSKLRPYLRKVAVPHFAGRCTPEALVYRPTMPALDRSYLALVLQSEPAIAHADQSSAGSRMPRTSVALMSSLKVALPPVSEQLRIVDLIGALDTAIEAARTASSATLEARDRFLDSKFGGAERVPVRSLLAGIEGGRSPLALDMPPAHDQFGVLKVSAVTSLGFEPRQSKTVTGTSIFSEHHLVRAGDVLVTRANTAALVGQVCFVPEDHNNLYLCDKTLRLKPADGVPPTALVAALNSPAARVQLSAAATGTSASMKNISQDNIRDVRVSWPVDAELAGLTDQSLLASHRCSQTTIAELHGLRSALLTALLSGEHEIPESYDELMEVAS